MANPGSNSWEREARNETDFVWGVCMCVCVRVRVHMHACVRGDVLVGTARLGEKCQPRALWPYNLLGKRIKAVCLQISTGQAGAGGEPGDETCRTWGCGIKGEGLSVSRP